MKVLSKLPFLALMALGATAQAQLVTTVQDNDPSALAGAVDGVLGADEYGLGNIQSIAGSGTTGFGGAVGTGRLYLDADASTLKMGFQPGANLNDNLVVYLDTRAGGFTTAQLGDTQDGGRTSVSNPTRDGNLNFGPEFLPDFAVVLGNFGVVSFELAEGGNGSLVFQQFFGDAWNSGGDTDFREVALNSSLYGITNTSSFKFQGYYTSETGFLSNETIPGQPGLNADNIGFGTAGQVYDATRYAAFAPVPEPASMAVLGLGLAALRRRRAKK